MSRRSYGPNTRVILFPSPSPVAFAFVELQCVVPNFRGSALSLQQSSTVARATRKPLAAWTTVQAKTGMVVEAGSLPSRFCLYAFLNPCFPPVALGDGSLMVSLITTQPRGIGQIHGWTTIYHIVTQEHVSPRKRFKAEVAVSTQPSEITSLVWR